MRKRVDWPAVWSHLRSAVGLVLSSGPPARPELAIEDLTELRRRLARAERLAIAGELAASAAHEIKNPLAPIRGYAQMLSERLAAVAERERPLFERGLKVIREETERIDRRVTELLRQARAEADAGAAGGALDLNRVLAEAAAVAEGEPGAPRIVQRLDPSIEHVVGSADQIRGAALNLIKNAIEAVAVAGRPDASVEVVTRREEHRAIVEILDNGTGLEPSAAEHLFEVFYTTKRGGTGLGLAIARSAVEAAGGSISLEPRRDRTGAIARIELDLAPGARSIPESKRAG